MKLIQLLEEAIKTGAIIYTKGWYSGMRYNKDNDCFIWCNPKTGEFNKSNSDFTGFNRVILSNKILETENWELISPKYKYNIGDKFLFNDLRKDITDTEGYIMSQTLSKPIGEIIDRHIAEDDGCEYYNVKIEKDFGNIIVGEHYLSKQLKVIKQ